MIVRPETVVVLWLVAFGAVYGSGLLRLWHTAGAGKGISRLQAFSFGAGWLTLVIALIGPVDRISDVLFSAHMIQHELLMVVAAPLIAASSPIVAATWLLRPNRTNLPNSTNPRTLRALRTLRTLRTFYTDPAFVWLLHAFVLWVWHLPFLFQIAMRHESIHIVQHFCFFSTACLFWWGMAHGRYGRLGFGAAFLYIFTTAVHSGVLGALMTFSPSIWYPVYARTTAAWGFTPLEDQQVAGLIMWVPASAIFLVVGLAFLAAWIRESARRVAAVAN
jgi:putative membrane protein